jgi:hypothetical protein
MVDDFERGMAMMRKHNPQVQEDGFGLVKSVAAQHVQDLITAYTNETDRGLRCWMLELLGEARSTEALAVFSQALEDPDDSVRSWGERGLKRMGTSDARTLLWENQQRRK